ncbi:efflux RND transporter permease subunit [Pseudoclavibacter sp. CFCC 13611]|uniref:efflux RND transporter permease subunit n=1 Tax=Pseudoclavibacter sp. CFCC 13611 TaxID=2615178 RepID=UPI0013013F73|nr:efflux RND transporter permease subunit [Pseudoclavibacter sp. CFCC 13611]KAB1664074.1 efflux RND transporter permease subunit [Pseudoclavibacter sp. CFCC 13611]
MSRLTALSMRNRALIALITIVVAFFGVFSMTGARQELMPSIELPMVVVQSSSPGDAPDVVDAQISAPIEAAVQSVEGIESTSSTSSTGVSMVTAKFAFGTDRVGAEQKVQQAVNRISSQLPKDLDPIIATGSTDDLPVIMLSAASSQVAPVDIAERLRSTVTNDLEHVDGVASATVVGGGSREVRVVPDQTKLAQHGLTAASISQALAANGTVGGAGSITEGDRDLSVRVGDSFASTDDLAALPLLPATGGASQSAAGAAGQSASAGASQGATAAGGAAQSAAIAPVRLGDVAQVTLTEAPVTGISRVDGQPAVTIQVTKRPTGNTVEVSKQINAQVDELQAKVGNDITLSVMYDQAPSIEQSIESLTTEGLLGLAFAIVVILLFLLSVRSTLVTAISIPTSLLVTFIGIEAAGYSLNVLTLGALTIAIGRVVDDSIVVIENINRHLALERGERKSAVILHGVREVAGAITASTLTTAAVFLPVGFVTGLVGELFKPFAFTVVIALIASLLVSLTIVPVLAYWLLRGPKESDAPTGESEGEGDALPRGESRRRQRTLGATDALADEPRTRLQRWYEPVLRGTLRHPALTLVGAVVVLGVTLALTPLMQTNFIGDSGQNTASISQALRPGTSLESATQRALPVEQALRDVDGVQTVSTTVGSSGGISMASFAGGGAGQSTLFQVAFADGADAAKVQQKLRDALNAQPDADDLSLSTSGGAGVSNDIAIDVEAPDDQRLEDAANQLVSGAREIDDVAEVTSSLSSTIDTLHVAVDRQRAAEHGMTESQIVQTLAPAMNPQQVAKVTIDSKDVSVVVRSDEQPKTADELRALPVTTPTGTVRLDALADVQTQQVPQSISSVRGSRSATVTITPAGESLNTVSAGVTKLLDDTQLPAGVTASIGGVLSDQASAFSSLGLALLAAVLIVYVIMVATFKSLRQPLLLLVSIPFAATGALAALLISGTPLGAASLVGLLMLVGIVVTNAIVLIDLVNQFRAKGVGTLEAIVEGASRRLRPILMTAAATVFALVPMALGITGHAGFISQPLALVVIGGLVSSTLLTLIVLPVLYWAVEGHRDRRDRARSRRLSAEASTESAPA